ncbi:glycosyltransferase [Thalassotalea ponticola]|uniref:glycosyltransferase n=1 Tax=Thalassotalea ponticola TaxID=1523392 RepID=UPI0025B3D7FC|nr:glycosyltransferase [Thalassotalea ponticola]MDN3652412.1 glycosyltransferase [Thalassotalea ponticola]
MAIFAKSAGSRPVPNRCERVIIFGQGRHIEQWRQMTEGYQQIHFCTNLTELTRLPVKGSAILFAHTYLWFGLKLALRFKLKGYSLVMRRWMGTDLLLLKRLSAINKLWVLPILRHCIDCNFTSAPWLSDDLKRLAFTNVHNWEAPTPLYQLSKKLSKQDIEQNWQARTKVIIIYSNDQREWLYRTEQMLALAKSLPDYQFVLVGHLNKQLSSLANVQSLGIVEQDQMHQLYLRSHFLIRITEHDGYSRMVVEAQQYGLQVISNQPRLFAHFADSNEQIIDVLRSIQRPNPHARHYALTHFTPQKWTQTLLKQLQSGDGTNTAKVDCDYISSSEAKR